MKRNEKFRTKKGKFNHELVTEALNTILLEIKQIVINFSQNGDEIENIPESSDEESIRKIHHLTSSDFVILPLQGLLSHQNRQLVLEISDAFLKGNKLEGKTTTKFIYKQLINLLGEKSFCTLSKIERNDSINLFKSLKDIILKEISTIKTVVISVVGGSLKNGQRCTIGSVDFTNAETFLNERIQLWNSISNDDYPIFLRESSMNRKADLIAQVKIKDRDSLMAKNSANEAMRRIYVLIGLIYPGIGYQYSFIGTLGEEYLDPRHSLLMEFDDNDNVISLVSSRTRNRFTSEEYNLLDKVELLSNLVYDKKVKRRPDWSLIGLVLLEYHP